MPQPNYGLDPYEQEAGDIERRRKYADLLRAQSMAPIQPAQAGRMTAPIHWTQGAAKMLQGYNAMAGEKSASDERKALSGRYQSDLADTLRRAGEAQRGTPATFEDASGNYAPQAARGPDPMGAASIYMQHPATRALGIGEIQRQNQAAALRGALEQFGTQQAAGQATGGVGGAGAGAQGGINPTSAPLVNLALMPGGANIAKLISDREIAAGKQGLDRDKYLRGIYEWEHLSAAQRADLGQKGIKNALDLAEARDKGIDVSSITMPQIPTNAPVNPSAPPAARTTPTASPANFPRETPQERSTRQELRVRILQQELAAEQAQPPSAERDRNIADLQRELKGAGVAAQAPASNMDARDRGAIPATPGLSPRGQREAAEEAAKVEARERAKLKVEMPEVRQRVQIQTQDLDRLSTAAREIIGRDLSRATGPMGAVPSWPGGSAAQAESLISSLKAQVSGMKLQAMREASKTGGAVGNVTEKEWPRLENMIVALDPVKQGPALFRQKLTELIGEIDKVKGSLGQAFQTQYGEAHSPQQGGAYSDAEKERRYQEFKRRNGG